MINNVETFANVPQILARGVEWYKTAGVHGSRGLKFVGVSGHVARPGVFEVPMGTPMREVIYQHAGGIRGGRALKAFAPSGPSSGYLPASMVDVRLDFKALAEAGSMLGSGAIVVCDDTTCMLDMALTAVRFYRNESLREVRAVPHGLAEDGGFAGALDPRRRERGAVSRGPDAGGGVVAGHEPHFHLRARTDCAGADSIRAETFPGGD